MKTPTTQEEKDYREDLTNRISAINNMQALFADVEDRGRKLEILKSLISTLNYGDDLLAILDAEIEMANKQAEEEAKAAEAENANTEETPEVEDMDLELPNSSEAEIAEESFDKDALGNLLLEDGITVGADLEEALPTPEELNIHKDFSQNE